MNDLRLSPFGSFANSFALMLRRSRSDRLEARRWLKNAFYPSFETRFLAKSLLRMKERGVSKQPLSALGILLGAVFASAPCLAQTAYAPIDCAKASSPVEKAICGDYALGQDEARVATLYGVLTSLVAMGTRGDMMDAQRKWIGVRNACGADSQCLTRAYQTRIGDLSKQFDALTKHGPF